MNVVIRRPVIGQLVRSDEMGITGKIVEVYSYEEAVAKGLRSHEVIAINEGLRLSLGEDFRNLYFEAVVKITYAKKKSGYIKGEVAVMVWDEYQRAVILQK